MAKRKTNKEVVVKEEVAIEEIDGVEPVEETLEIPVLLEGTVTCKSLNIRQEGSTEAAVLCTVRENSILLIDTSKSTDEFYAVYTEAGTSGFAMKKFVKIKS